MRVFTPLAVLLAYILLLVYVLMKVFVQKIFSEILSQCQKLSHSAKNTLIHNLIHWAELYPTLIHWAEIYPILINWADLYPILIHWAESYLNTLRSAANQSWVVGQPESNITSPGSSRLGWISLFGSRLDSAGYSLSWYIGTSNPLPTPDLLTHLLLMCFHDICLLTLTWAKMLIPLHES